MVSLSSATFITSASALDGCPPDQGLEVAFAGRSNAGKSSALNAITRRRGLSATGASVSTAVRYDPGRAGKVDTTDRDGRLTTRSTFKGSLGTTRECHHERR